MQDGQPVAATLFTPEELAALVSGADAESAANETPLQVCTAL
eukprot:SAG11_NODE_32633_length_282_cov_0.562842_1_plen_41_part_10